jgi:hypothetical protein
VYVNYCDLEGMIPVQFLVQALDDAGTGQPTAWATVQSQACEAVDALLCGRYDTPFQPDPVTGSYPAIVTMAAKNFAAELCYNRRGRIEDSNPYRSAADTFRRQLTRIGAGQMPLTPEIDVTTQSGTAITEPSSIRPGRRRLIV